MLGTADAFGNALVIAAECFEPLGKMVQPTDGNLAQARPMFERSFEPAHREMRGKTFRD